MSFPRMLLANPIHIGRLLTIRYIFMVISPLLTLPIGKDQSVPTMNLLNQSDYRSFLKDYIRALPKRGHGFKLRIAEELRVHPTLITQILNGQKSFTMDQAYSLVQFLKFNDLEKDYFLTLVELDRAGTDSLKKFVERKLLKLRQEAEKVKNRVAVYSSLSESDQATFYSQWFYSALRLSCGIGKDATAKKLSRQFDLPSELVDQVVGFLLSKGLLVERSNKTLAPGPQNTFLSAESPLISRHHMNWRLKAMERHMRLGPDELAFSAPVTVSEKDVNEIRKMCLSFIQSVSQKVAESPAEALACMNIDWCRVF